MKTPASAFIAVAILTFSITARSSDFTTTTVSAPATTSGHVVAATMLYFDADGEDGVPREPAMSWIGTPEELAAFVARFIDGELPLLDAQAALRAGDMLFGGRISSGCFPASSGHLEYDGGDIVAVADGVADRPTAICVRAITSIALFSVDRTHMPLTITSETSR